MDPVQKLREAITSGVFTPNERLIEHQLVDFLATNRTKVRTTLARLEQEGLVVIEPNRGARVRLVSDVEALEITQARGVLEGLVARQAAENINDDGRSSLRNIIGEMEALLDGGDVLGYSAGASRLHAEIQRLSGHTTATRLLENLDSQIIRFQYRTVLMTGRAAKALQEHKEIVEVICSGDGEKAEQIMRAHLEGVQLALKTTIEKTRS
ncbi:GntR family transcriptional regulator [Terrihabitans soli]|uniref:GntR family transcriptional regulator n=2 Tax=Terrihabitans soli TaxID=708113 RepID=A0A6S6QY38_9HYPH|nr:GntR family transcriptional regulator [Terrihabitans soli]